jgi:hypothetical protein
MSACGGPPTSVSFAEVKAIASGNPAVLTLAEIEADVQRLTLLKRSHADEQYRARQQVKHLPEDIERLTRKAEACDADHALAAAAGDTITVGGRVYRDREKAIEAMNALLKERLANVVSTTRRWEVGVYHGLRLTLEADTGHKPEMIFSGGRSYRREFGSVAAGNLFNFIDGTVDMLPQQARKARDEARLKASQLEGFQGAHGAAVRAGRPAGSLAAHPVAAGSPAIRHGGRAGRDRAAGGRL